MKMILWVLLIASPFSAMANQQDFCEGFKIGYTTVRGNNSFVPYCPYSGYTPYGSSDFQEGIKKGMAKGHQDKPVNSWSNFGY